MAAFVLNSETTYHARSISLPSRPHPLTVKVEEQLNRLRSSEGSSTSSIEHSSAGLKDLHDCVDDLVQLPLTQQVLAREKSDKCVNEVFDGSLRMLEVCSITRDVLLQTKECVQDLQSALRRKRGEELGIDNEVASLYMTSRKQVNRTIQRCFVDLKKTESKRVFSALFEKDHNVVAIVGMLREVESMSLSLLESLLSSLLGSRPRSKSNGWCVVSKLMNAKRNAAHCDMEKVDH
ncbi:Eukaryotic translation initiation factor 3 subunit a protein, partial [Thalictrum thalictroides]